jgi:broad specificity phosphatase PhoE
MKKLCIILVTLFSCNLYAAGDFTRLILLRHAEKSHNQSKDPALSEKGKKRADALKDLLKFFDIKAVYSSKYLRTIQTAKPLAEKAKLEINSDIAANDYSALSEHINSLYEKQTVLVVGHGNTVPAFVNFITKQDKYENLREDEFNKIFFVEIHDQKIESYKFSFEARDGRLSLGRSQ